MKRYVIATNRTTAEQDHTFVNILRARWPRLGWWHQLSETWLIVDLSGQLTTSDLRDAAKEAFPGVHILVLDASEPSKWSAFATPNECAWIRDEWDQKE